MEQGGISDACKFEGKLLIENQPQVEAPSPVSHSIFVLVFGSVVQLCALYWCFKRPSFAFAEDAASAGNALMFLNWIGQLLAGLLVNALGMRMVDGMGNVLNTYRFRSTAVLLDIKGNFARSQVRIGKVISDSIESENLVVRSDCSISGYTAKLLTESRGLKGLRTIIGMAVDDSTMNVQEIIGEWLERFEKRGATIVGVDLKDHKLIEMVQANIGVASSQAKAVRAANALLESLDPVPPPALIAEASAEQPVAAQEDPSGQTKVCPEGAETVKAAALKCRFCGYRFDEPKQP
jgi:hypothetical protein